MFSPMDHHLRTLGWHLSPHAAERIHSRGIRPSQLVAALTSPDLTYPDRGDQIQTFGRLAVVVNPRSRTILTVLVTGASRWDEHEARAIFALA